MRKHLLLVTSSYPFGQGETFLEPELAACADAFERVTILPITGSGARRAVPNNVTVATPVLAEGASRTRFYLRQGLRARTLGLAIREMIQAALKHRRFHPAVWLRIWSRALYRTALETNITVRSIIDAPSGVVAYCYWGHVPALAAPCLHRVGIPVAVRYHGSDLYLDAFSTYNWLSRNARYFPWQGPIEASSRTSLFVSDQGIDYYRSTWPESTSSAKIVFRLGARGRDKPITHQGTEKSRRLKIASCASFVPEKRNHLVAKLVIEISKRTTVTWDHFGGGDSSETQKLISGLLSAKTPVNLHGHIPNPDLRQFYQNNAIDLFVNLSTTEGIPVSIMEAMAYDIPVVATDVGGTSEAVITGKSGLLIHADDAERPEELATRILKELEPGGALERSRPRDIWAERFDADANARRLVQHLLELDGALATGTNP